MSDFPDVRRARREEQERIGTLWLDFLNGQAALDPRLDIADDALERWTNDFPVWLDDETRRIYVAAPDDAIQGIATAHRSGPPPIYAPVDEVYLDELYVVPDARRRGLGTQLVCAVRHWAETVSARRVRFQTMAANESAQVFWKRVGAEPFSTAMTLELNSSETPPSSESRIGF